MQALISFFYSFKVNDDSTVFCLHHSIELEKPLNISVFVTQVTCFHQRQSESFDMWMNADCIFNFEDESQMFLGVRVRKVQEIRPET